MTTLEELKERMDDLVWAYQTVLNGHEPYPEYTVGYAKARADDATKAYDYALWQESKRQAQEATKEEND